MQKKVPREPRRRLRGAAAAQGPRKDRDTFWDEVCTGCGTSLKGKSYAYSVKDDWSDLLCGGCLARWVQEEHARRLRRERPGEAV